MFGPVGKSAESEKGDFQDMEVDPSYDGPTLTFPLTLGQVEQLIEAFKEQRLLHPKYVLQVLSETQKVMSTKKNINRATTAIAKQITVCGQSKAKAPVPLYCLKILKTKVYFQLY